MRIDGDATVGPGQRSASAARVLKAWWAKYSIHEGESVKSAGNPAEMDAWDLRSSLAAAEAKYRSALLQMESCARTNDGGEAEFNVCKRITGRGEQARAAGIARTGATSLSDRRGDCNAACRHVRGTPAAIRRYFAEVVDTHLHGRDRFSIAQLAIEPRRAEPHQIVHHFGKRIAELQPESANVSTCGVAITPSIESEVAPSSQFLRSRLSPSSNPLAHV